MQHKRQSTLPAFLKVDMRSRSPRLWSWSIHHDAVDMVLMRSDERFRCAEDAWEAGQAALMDFEMPDTARCRVADAA
jgi:hypothetical protein